MEQDEPLLEIEECEDGLRVVKRFEVQNDGCGDVLGGLLAVASAGISYAYETWEPFLEGALCAAIVTWWLARRRRAGEDATLMWREDVWHVNTARRRLEHNGQMVARFSEMRVVWADSTRDEDGDWNHCLRLTMHRNRSMLDKTLLCSNGPEADRALFERAALLIAQHSGARLRGY